MNTLVIIINANRRTPETTRLVNALRRAPALRPERQ
jgi:hypothetical protein